MQHVFMSVNSGKFNGTSDINFSAILDVFPFRTQEEIWPQARNWGESLWYSFLAFFLLYLEIAFWKIIELQMYIYIIYMYLKLRKTHPALVLCKQICFLNTVSHMTDSYMYERDFLAFGLKMFQARDLCIYLLAWNSICFLLSWI